MRHEASGQLRGALAIAGIQLANEARNEEGAEESPRKEPEGEIGKLVDRLVRVAEISRAEHGRHRRGSREARDPADDRPSRSRHRRLAGSAAIDDHGRRRLGGFTASAHVMPSVEHRVIRWHHAAAPVRPRRTRSAQC